MTLYYIESLAGVPFGIYQGATRGAAVEALNEESGSDSLPSDWTVIEVASFELDWEREATIYTLENGDSVECSGPHICYIRK